MKPHEPTGGEIFLMVCVATGLYVWYFGGKH